VCACKCVCVCGAVSFKYLKYVVRRIGGWPLSLTLAMTRQPGNATADSGNNNHVNDSDERLCASKHAHATHTHLHIHVQTAMQTNKCTHVLQPATSTKAKAIDRTKGHAKWNSVCVRLALANHSHSHTHTRTPTHIYTSICSWQINKHQYRQTSTNGVWLLFWSNSGYNKLCLCVIYFHLAFR